MFLTLLHKDWRLAKPSFFFTIVLLFIPSTVGILLTLYSRFYENKMPLLRYTPQDHNDLMELFVGGFALCGLSAPAIAACAFGRERREKTGEFLGALPIARRSIVSAKLLTTLALLAIPLCFAWIAVFSHVATGPSTGTPVLQLVIPLTVYSLAFLGTCALAWLLSCILSSDVLSTAAALAIMTFCCFTVYLAFFIIPSLKTMNLNTRSDAMTWTFAVLFGFFTLSGFTGGTLIALSRPTI